MGIKGVGKCIVCQSKRYVNDVKLCKRCNKLTTPEVITIKETREYGSSVLVK